jgi:multiple sugar transport system permease protein/raffinose/stachyose/melibiose transport system permease protein
MKKTRLASLLLHFVLLLCSVATILPFLWMLASSLKTNPEISALSQSFWSRTPTLDNYRNALQKMSFLRYFGNSLLYAVSLTGITVYTSAVSGFVLCKYRFRGRQLLFGAILATMMVPGVVTIIPRYSIMQALGWLDTLRSLLVPAAFTSFGIFMMRQSCFAIPDEMLEAARIDGGNEFYLLHRIVLPMLQNAISSIAIFQFLWAWEDYLWPYLMIRTQSRQVLSVALNLYSGRYSTDYAGLFAATAIAIVPVVACYLVFQRRFIEGIASAAVKG